MLEGSPTLDCLTSRLALALTAACLLVPVAAAAPPHEAEGRLQMPDGVAMHGDFGVQGAGLLELGRPGGDAGLAIDFAALVDGVLMDRTRDKFHLLVPLPVVGQEPSVVASPGENRTPVAAEGPGRIENVRCGTQCQVAVIAAPGQGLLGAEGFVDATLRPTVHERVFSTAKSDQNHSTQTRYVVPAGAVEVEAADFADATPWTSGRVTLLVVDAVFDLVEGDRRTTFDVRWWNETTQEAAGQPVQVRHHGRYANLTLDGARLGLVAGAPFRLSFPAGADSRLDGALSADGASGVLAVGGKRHDLDGDSVLLEGSLAARLRGTAPALLGDAPAVDAEVQGKVTRADISGASVLPWRPSVTAEMGGGLLALLGLAALGRLFLAPLYHRLGPSDLLANPNRRRIHDAIRERPGVDVGTLVASVGLSRVLVRHHLRMLEAHGLVRATVWRRRRTYALVGAASGLAAACELKDPTRRRVAAAVARSGGATQKGLAAALGLSQRLVSYHLACLGDSSLVRAEGRNPRVYVATEALLHALGNEEAPAPALENGRVLARPMEKEGQGAVAAVATTV